MSSNRKYGYNVSFDNMPEDYKQVHIKKRNTFPVADPDKEE